MELFWNCGASDGILGGAVTVTVTVVFGVVWMVTVDICGDAVA